MFPYTTFEYLEHLTNAIGKGHAGIEINTEKTKLITCDMIVYI